MKIIDHPLYKKHKPAKRSLFYGKLSDLVAAESSLQLIVQIENDLRQRLRAARAVVIQADWSAPTTDKELLRVHNARLLVPELQEAVTIAAAERNLREKAVRSAKKPVDAVLNQFGRYEMLIERSKQAIIKHDEQIERGNELVKRNYRKAKIDAQSDIKKAETSIAELRAVHMA